MSPHQAYGGWLHYECEKGHFQVLNDEWPTSLTRPCIHKKKEEDPPCGAPSILKVIRERKPKGTEKVPD